MKRVIFRVDDRLIHGQVIEGWIKNFRITKVIVVSDRVLADTLQQSILSAAVPAMTEVRFAGAKEFAAQGDLVVKNSKDYLLVLFESLSDLQLSENLINEDTYVNIGCVASRKHSEAVSDTVFLEPKEMEYLALLKSKWEVHIKKLPWEAGA